MSQFSIIGTPLYQWEKGRQLKITPLQGMYIDSVHFSNYGDSTALVVKPKEKDGAFIADIPNILLQDDRNIVVYSVNVSEDKTETLRECVFSVCKRAKPSDYVYTETEILSYHSLADRITALEDGGTGGGSGTVDQTYTPESTNAQSGVAVSQAVEKAVEDAKSYTDRNRIYVSHEYNPTNGQAMSGIAVAEAVKGKLDTIYDDITCIYEAISIGDEYIFTLLNEERFRGRNLSGFVRGFGSNHIVYTYCDTMSESPTETQIIISIGGTVKYILVPEIWCRMQPPPNCGTGLLGTWVNITDMFVTQDKIKDINTSIDNINKELNGLESLLASI